MALTLDTTLSGQASNSYVTVEYADEYWNQHFLIQKADLWAALNPGRKVSALIAACRIVESARFTLPMNTYVQQHSTWQLDRETGLVIELQDTRLPYKASFRQTLQFPRVIDRDETGALFIPEAVMNAQCEQAVYLLTLDDDAIANRLKGVESESIAAGQVKVTQTLVGGGSMLAPMAVELLSPYFIRASGKLYRG